MGSHFHSQLKRLEKILIHDGLLVGDHIIAKDEEVEQVTKGQITDTVDFISYFEKSNLPNWF